MIKKAIFAGVCFMALAAYAGDVINSSIQVQTGTGVNDMTQAPPSGACSTAGVAVQSSKFSAGGSQGHCAATEAFVSIGMTSGNTLIQGAKQEYMRGFVCGFPNPDGGASNWASMNQLDILVDAGSSPVIEVFQVPLPVLPAGAYVDWTAENFLQSATADAGVSVQIQLLAPSSCVSKDLQPYSTP